MWKESQAVPSKADPAYDVKKVCFSECPKGYSGRLRPKIAVQQGCMAYFYRRVCWRAKADCSACLKKIAQK